MSPRIRSPQRAVDAVLHDLQLALSCVTDAVLTPVRRKSQGAAAPVAITFGGRSGRAKLARGIWISVAMEVQPSPDDHDPGAWRTHTVSYVFSVFGSEKGADEWLCLHYHPASGARRPHLHVNALVPWSRSGLRKKHLVTGRVCLEDFVQMLIEEFGASPRRMDWEAVLDCGRRTFSARRTW